MHQISVSSLKPNGVQLHSLQLFYVYAHWNLSSGIRHHIKSVGYTVYSIKYMHVFIREVHVQFTASMCASGLATLT